MAAAWLNTLTLYESLTFINPATISWFATPNPILSPASENDFEQVRITITFSVSRARGAAEMVEEEAEAEEFEFEEGEEGAAEAEPEEGKPSKD